MKNTKFIYLYFFAGVLFLITSGAFYLNENSNLTSAFASLGFAMLSIGFVFLSRVNRCKTDKSGK